MKFLSSYALAACAAAAILAGCSGGSGSPSSALGSTGLHANPGAHVLGQSRTAFASLRSVVPHSDRRKSWRSPKLKADSSGRLLFVSDVGDNDVYIFSMPSLTLMATVTGFNEPQGMCSDKTGDVWVTNTNTLQIFKLNRSGSIVGTLNDSSGYPVGCAWDKKTGNLAVTNISDPGSTPGQILVYPGASGTPTAYTDPDMAYYYFPAYDKNGNLFVDGFDSSDTYFVLAKLPKNANSASTVTIGGGTIYFPGTVQWVSRKAGPYLIVGDQECGGNVYLESSCLYAVSLSGRGGLTGTITGSTPLDNSTGSPACDVTQGVRNGERFFGSDYEYSTSSGYGCASGGSVASATNLWAYPGGGTPLRTSPNAESAPVGAAISQP